MINGTGNRLTAEIRRQSKLAQDIARTEIQVSTGKRLLSASDDPVGAARISSLRRSQSDDSIWASNLSLGGSLASQADSVLATVSERLSRAQELMVAGASQSVSPADRNAIGLELRGIADEINSLSSTRSSLDEPLFATGNPVEIRFGESSTFAPVPRRSDVFEVGGTAISVLVLSAATAVEGGNAANISQSLTDITGSVGAVANSAADVGVRASRIARLSESLATRAIEFASERSALEDTDLSEALARLSGQRLTLQAAQAAFARINSQTLFDILQ
ncbi:MAG: flagellin [Pseudomonadota bacterium]